MRVAECGGYNRAQPHASLMPAPSRRAASLGTENAFVVLAEVDRLVRSGKDVICAGDEVIFPVPGFRCALPGGAFYAWPNVCQAYARIGAQDYKRLRARLLDEAGVAVLADIHFGPRIEGKRQHIRLSYATSEAAIEAGVARIADFIRKASR